MNLLSKKRFFFGIHGKKDADFIDNILYDCILGAMIPQNTASFPGPEAATVYEMRFRSGTA